MPDLNPTVRGYCPACRGESLFLGDGGYVTCARLECPEPDAVSTLLERRPVETPASQDLTVRYVGSWWPTCPEQRHLVHPDITCEEADQVIEHNRSLINAIGRHLDVLLGTTPPALRGPNWKA